MFRNKPYTKCIDCLSNNRLKCKKCMEQIIEDVSKNSLPKRFVRMKEFSATKHGHSKYTQYKKEELKNRHSMEKLKENK